MPDYSNLPPNYAGTPFPDGNNKSIVTLGRHNKWGYVAILGPDNKEYTLGLMDSFTITEDNGTAWLPQAGADWLELVIGNRMWSGSATKKHVRGADMKQQMQRIYPGVSDVDFRYLPFILKYNFIYKPPLGGTGQPYETASWVYHKMIIIRYTNQLITGPNQLLAESFDFIAAGEAFTNGNAQQYQSNPIVWSGDTYANAGQAPQANPAAATTAITTAVNAAAGAINNFFPILG